MTRKMTPKKKVLIVDDSETMRAWSRDVLEGAGYDVTTTDNPVLVPSMMFRGKYDLVLLDISMPLLNGTQVASLMRESALPSKIVLYSSQPLTEIRTLAGECKADGYIQKCSNPNRFLREVGRILGK